MSNYQGSSSQQYSGQLVQQTNMGGRTSPRMTNMAITDRIEEARLQDNMIK